MFYPSIQEILVTGIFMRINVLVDTITETDIHGFC